LLDQNTYPLVEFLILNSKGLFFPLYDVEYNRFGNIVDFMDFIINTYGFYGFDKTDKTSNIHSFDLAYCS
ncbi:17670_t:CDS:1, partial [Racocetra fulgida]